MKKYHWTIFLLIAILGSLLLGWGSTYYDAYTDFEEDSIIVDATVTHCVRGGTRRSLSSRYRVYVSFFYEGVVYAGMYHGRSFTSVPSGTGVQHAIDPENPSADTPSKDEYRVMFAIGLVASVLGWGNLCSRLGKSLGRKAARKKREALYADGCITREKLLQDLTQEHRSDCAGRFVLLGIIAGVLLAVGAVVGVTGQSVTLPAVYAIGLVPALLWQAVELLRNRSDIKTCTMHTDTIVGFHDPDGSERLPWDLSHYGRWRMDRNAYVTLKDPGMTVGDTVYLCRNARQKLVRLFPGKEFKMM